MTSSLAQSFLITQRYKVTKNNWKDKTEQEPTAQCTDKAATVMYTRRCCRRRGYGGNAQTRRPRTYRFRSLSVSRTGAFEDRHVRTWTVRIPDRDLRKFCCSAEVARRYSYSVPLRQCASAYASPHSSINEERKDEHAATVPGRRSIQGRVDHAKTKETLSVSLASVSHPHENGHCVYLYTPCCSSVKLIKSHLKLIDEVVRNSINL